MTWTVALLAVLACLGLLRVLGVPARAAGVLVRSRRALAELRSPTMSDLDKERAMRGHAGAMFVQFVVITALSTLALAVPAGVVWLLDRAGLCGFDAVLDATMSWTVLTVATVVGCALWLLGRKR